MNSHTYPSTHQSTHSPTHDDIPNSESPPELSPPNPSAPAWHSLIPTGYNLPPAIVYALTLILGSLFSLLSPSPSSTTSYFSHKSNLFNLLFVKYGWLWTTLVFALHLTRLRHSSRPQALLRYALATLWWILITQWFFGAPIMDRTFTFTGGACRLVEKHPDGAQEVLGSSVVAATSAACRVAGGRWRGGHDLSGHAFLLTHASLFLWSEVAPVVRRAGFGGWETSSVLGIMGVWWWMLLMTGVYFHTWREKLTGWIAAMVQWTALYVWALRTQPQIRSVVGVPGV